VTQDDPGAFAIDAADRHIKAMLASLDEPQANRIAAAWDDHFPNFAHPGQLAPAGEWQVWMVMGGRGFGKTRAGAEYVRSIAEGNMFARIALVGATLGEARSVMVEGESGLIAISPTEDRPSFEPSLHRLRWPNGAQAFLYSAAEPESLRGPQHSHAWCDEIGKWPAAHERATRCWDNLLLGLRLGKDQRIVATTTPRNTPLVRRIFGSEGTVVTGCATRANSANLPKTFISAMEREFGGSTLGRQELGGELIEEIEGALWTRELLESRGSFMVELAAAGMGFASSDMEGIARGQNRLMVGAELLQFLTCEQTDERRWRLSGLLRGRAGTDVAAVTGHQAGVSVVLADGPLVSLGASMALDPESVGVAAIGRGDSEPVLAPVENFGLGTRPLCPVHGFARNQGAADLQIGWIRRARGAWLWDESIDLPVNEDFLRFEVGIGPVESPVVRWETPDTSLKIDAGLAALHGGQSLWVRQIGRRQKSVALLLAEL
jgi:hypothetical protein